MAVKDVISRGIGPSTALSYFVTGGFAIGAAVALSAPDLCVLAEDETVLVPSESETLLVAAETETLVVARDWFSRMEEGALLYQGGGRLANQKGGDIVVPGDVVVYDLLVDADETC